MDWEFVKFRVGSYCVAHPIAFSSSTSYWHTGELPGKAWSLECEGDMTEPTVLKTSRASIEITGDCNANVSVPHGGLVHVHGNMNGTLTLGGHAEVVIGGELTAAIEGSGISHVFVGGNAKGYIRHSDSLSIWIEGDCNAEVITGTPSTNLYVQGNFTGKIHPISSDAALLWLFSGGFVRYETLMDIAKFGYTQFIASVAISDRIPGYHPSEDDFARLGIKHRPMWLVHAVKSSANGSSRGVNGMFHN